MNTPPPKPRHMFSYNPDTGDLRWRKRPSQSLRAGDPVGTITKTGRMYLNCKRKSYPCICVAFWVHTGEWDGDVQPIDGDWTNLEFENIERL